ncbi:hypothetical protein HOP52_18095 [Halomonas campisalis]|uniref:Uncharacterized protein n=1 Tax=Billgrantia campisalis TaxID=74661 RepID=A0ABS9PD20_9GAMM|nr:hypothetical protein [Halomonas campisalis]MCG6659663.1 hypothetical protein [Halomonas campisalis]MDR5864619.1 hypothetical protein [Halomonas campisalis]
MLKGLMWCLAVLVMQLLLLRYVDRRVAAMPRLGEEGPSDGAANLLAAKPEGDLEA